MQPTKSQTLLYIDVLPKETTFVKTSTEHEVFYCSPITVSYSNALHCEISSCWYPVFNDQLDTMKHHHRTLPGVIGTALGILTHTTEATVRATTLRSVLARHQLGLILLESERL